MDTHRTLKCSNCAQPLRTLTLTGHYERPVEIDLCDPCCLVWFDTTESVRLAGAGVAGLVKVIHAAMSSGVARTNSPSLSTIQNCPVCSAALHSVFNLSRFGRTAQMECPRGHGYYQTFMLYLAEKGFVRPILWADVKLLAGGSGHIYCANCGAGLEPRPQEACPYCQSAIGVLDPARLASAIEIAGDVLRAEAPNPDVQRTQARCAQCGGAIDATRDQRCPHCQAIVTRSDTAKALEATLAQPLGPRPSARARLKALSGASFEATEPRKRHAGLLAGSIFMFLMMAALYQCSHMTSGPLPPRQGALGVEAIGVGVNAEALECDPVAAQRLHVSLRELVIATTAPPGPVFDAVRRQANQARKEWVDGALHGYALRSMELMRSHGRNQLARIAFCLPVGEISPVFRMDDGFHVVQVVSAD
ncbi:MAG: hypothetical protein V4463_00145 [Pseudomonadota bacterium]